MDFKQSNIQEILDSEREMVIRGAERYGNVFVHASQMQDLLNNFIKSADPDRFIFGMFLSHNWVYAIEMKIAMETKAGDLFITTKQSVKINEDYLPKPS